MTILGATIGINGQGSDLLEKSNSELELMPHRNSNAPRQESSEILTLSARLLQAIERRTPNPQPGQEFVRPYQCLVAGCVLGVCITENARIVFCNDRFADIFGYEQNQLIGADICHLIAEEILWQTDSSGPCSPNGGVETVEREVNGRTKSGDILWVRESIARVNVDGDDLVIRSIVDITEPKTIEENLRRSKRELETLSDQLIKAQEAERKRIASELHDGIGQSLSAMKFTLESIALELRDEVSAARSEQLGRIVKRFKAAIEEVRRISMALRPSILDDLGIEATIGWFTREFRETYASIKLVQNVQIEEENIGANLKTAMFRILQEALNNVAKHARATEIRVSVTETGDEIRLQICDNGIGLLDSKVADIGHRFGINSMKERAKLSGGVLVISSAAKAGTTVEAVWPRRQKNFTPLN